MHLSSNFIILIKCICDFSTLQEKTSAKAYATYFESTMQRTNSCCLGIMDRVFSREAEQRTESPQSSGKDAQ